VLSLLVRNEEENVDWECGSLAIAFASGGMMWFGGCDVPAPLVMINETSRDFSPNNPPYLLTAMSLNLQMTLTSVDVSLWPFSSTLSSHVISWRMSSHGAQRR